MKVQKSQSRRVRDVKQEKVFALGFQHVLAMYAGAVVVPLIVGNALNLNATQMAYLIAADLFTCGLATLLQIMGTKYFGSRLRLFLDVPLRQ